MQLVPLDYSAPALLMNASIVISTAALGLKPTLSKAPGISGPAPDPSPPHQGGVRGVLRNHRSHPAMGDSHSPLHLLLALSAGATTMSKEK